MSEPLQEIYEAEMNVIATALDKYFNADTKPKKTGFCLLVFPCRQPNNEHKTNYISNTNTENILAVMKEFIARAEGRTYAHRERDAEVTDDDGAEISFGPDEEQES